MEESNKENEPTYSKIIDVKNRGIYIFLAVFLGIFGIHNYYAEYNKKATIQLLITVLLGWLIIPLGIVWIWVLFDICTIKIDNNGIMFK